MTRAQILSPRSQSGQAIVLIALMIIVLFGAIGLAVDGGIGYYYNNQAERAAAAAALSGVIFMPGQFTHAQSVPVGSRNSAWDRAQDEARRNGFDWNDAANGVSVTAAVVPGFDNKLSVTVSRNAPVFFMQLFGITTYRVSRTAIATYLPPLSLGQPGTQVGSTTAQLGTGGNNYFFMRTEGYSTPRSQGDAFTPDPAGSGDVHAISRAQGSDPIGATLPDRGGYNYLINLPNGGFINVYNAMFAPDNCTSNASDVNGAKVCPHRGGACLPQPLQQPRQRSRGSRPVLPWCGYDQLLPPRGGQPGPLLLWRGTEGPVLGDGVHSRSGRDSLHPGQRHHHQPGHRLSDRRNRLLQGPDRLPGRLPQDQCLQPDQQPGQLHQPDV